MVRTTKEWWFYFNLRLKSPSELAQEKGIESKIKDAYEAAKVFNAKFKGIKSVTVLDAQDKTRLDVIMHFKKQCPERVTAKELRSFSQYLINEKGWRVFSTEESKLFVPMRIVQMKWWEAQLAVEGECGHQYDDPESNEWGDAYFPDWAHSDYGIDIVDDEADAGDESILEGDLKTISTDDIDDMTDEQMLAVLKSILMTKNLGPEKASASKQRVIEEIKNLIYPWAIYGE
ncbi:hypothetical protein [Paenibacillus puerhi]|uniref:hypothetical protein n=1 Tax=Paenibacillus puerhi TaxID=2692622 RepID=UPI0013587A1C|nr:hypothetical protein [Paenibacillus puerhi]